MSISAMMVDSYTAVKPRVTFECDVDKFRVIRTLQDDDGNYLWRPGEGHAGLNSRYLGMDVRVRPYPCYQIRYVFPDGHEHIVQMNWPIEN